MTHALRWSPQQPVLIWGALEGPPVFVGQIVEFGYAASMRILRALAAVGVSASTLALVVSCTGGTVDTGSGNDASTGDAAATEAYSDASDANAPTTPCSKFVPVLCNFDGTCPDLAAIEFVAPSGDPQTAKDAGPDGSGAFSAYVGDGGGGAFFGMPYYDFEKQQDIPVGTTFPGCQITCEANMRLAAGPASVPLIINGGEDDWGLKMGATSGTQYAVTADASTVAIGQEWKHVRIDIAPTGPTSTLTITDSTGASTTTAVPIPRMGNSIYFGASGSVAGIQVYVDDIQCAITDPVPQ